MEMHFQAPQLSNDASSRISKMNLHLTPARGGGPQGRKLNKPTHPRGHDRLGLVSGRRVRAKAHGAKEAALPTLTPAAQR